MIIIKNKMEIKNKIDILERISLGNASVKNIKLNKISSRRS